ncbi:LuxR family transcriptional regulator [Novosphingobium sp. AAP83]|nr:LuxR family transcriptional regulator [Novosphingobium sp. AAP83]
MVDKELTENPLVALTAKQREVLDLLIQHKTSKEISRLLGISPHTVDQRIMLARGKLGVASRGEVAHAYRSLLETYEQPVYQLSHIGFPPLPAENSRQEDEVVDLPGTRATPPTIEASPTLQTSGIEGLAQVLAMPGETPGMAGQAVYHRVLPEMFDGPNGTLMRLGYIAAITVFLIIIVLGGLSMFAQLSSLLDR